MATPLGDKDSMLLERVKAGIEHWPHKGPCMLRHVTLPQFYNDIATINSLCDREHLKAEYYSKEKLLVLSKMPSPVHDCVQPWLECEIRRMRVERFIKDAHWYRRITRNYSTEFSKFAGVHRGSRRSPDASIQSLGKTTPNLVIEVAFSESAEHVRRKADFWLEACPTCQVVILVIIDEGPAQRRAGDDIITEGPNEGDNIDADGDTDCEDSDTSGDEDEDDDSWVGDLRITVQVVRRNIHGTYNEYDLRLRDVTCLDSALAQDSREYDSDDSSFSTESHHCNASGPTFAIHRADVYGNNIPRSLGIDTTFEVSTDTLRGYIARYRRALGRNRRTSTSCAFNRELREDTDYVD